MATAVQLSAHMVMVLVLIMLKLAIMLVIILLILTEVTHTIMYPIDIFTTLVFCALAA